jgi:two-component system phosphate regulon response regulator OmpR
MATVLVVEDETDLNRMIRDYLESKGFTTVEAGDGAGAVRAVFEQRPDIVLLDLNLPVLDGMHVARTIRAQTDVPIIVATARGEEEDRIDGFQAGVDDYVVKPFSLPELALRIEAVLRRVHAASARKNDGETDEVVAGDLRIDPARRRVLVHERPVELTAAQFAILRRLAESPGRVFTRMQLLESLQSDPYEGYERTVDVHIKNIRKAVEENPHEPRRIVTVRGVGYRLEETT